MRVVALHVTGVLNHLLVDIGAREIQMDEFWTFVDKKEKNATDLEKLHDGYGDRWVQFTLGSGGPRSPIPVKDTWTVDSDTEQ